MKRYSQLALILTNTLVLFCVVILGAELASAWHRMTHPQNKPVIPRLPFSQRKLDAKHLPPTPARLVEMRRDFQSLHLDPRSFGSLPPSVMEASIHAYVQRPPFIFSPYDQYADPPQQSEYLNMKQDRFGFAYRSNGGDEKRQTSEIFFFGGSTTYGSSLPDTSTIPAQLEKLVRKTHPSFSVVNYGRCGYSWFQELVLFERLLQAGHRPRAAVFLDGVNAPNRKQVPHWSGELGRLWLLTNTNVPQSLLPNSIALFSIINRVKTAKTSAAFERAFEEVTPPFSLLPPHDEAKAIIESYRITQKLIAAVAREYGVKTLFLWQPHRDFRCGREKYSAKHWQPLNTLPRYEYMKDFRAPDFHNLSLLCEKYGIEKYVFLDDVHYNHDFSGFIAGEIANRLKEM